MRSQLDSAKYIQMGAAFGAIVDFQLFLNWHVAFGLSLWAPLALWLLSPRGDFVEHHGAEAVRWQIFTSVVYELPLFVAFMVFGGVTLGLDKAKADPFSIVAMGSTSLLLVLGLCVLVVLQVLLPFRAAFRARRGEWYVYPWTFSPRKQNRNRVLVTA